MIADLFVRLSAAFLSPETSELVAVWRLPNASQSGDFYTLPYGYKREKNKGKVQNHSEARGNTELSS